MSVEDHEFLKTMEPIDCMNIFAAEIEVLDFLVNNLLADKSDLTAILGEVTEQLEAANRKLDSQWLHRCETCKENWKGRVQKF